jgi:hypothetical protein
MRLLIGACSASFRLDLMATPRTELSEGSIDGDIVLWTLNAFPKRGDSSGSARSCLDPGETSRIVRKDTKQDFFFFEVRLGDCRLASDGLLSDGCIEVGSGPFAAGSGVRFFDEMSLVQLCALAVILRCGALTLIER